MFLAGSWSKVVLVSCSTGDRKKPRRQQETPEGSKVERNGIVRRYETSRKLRDTGMCACDCHGVLQAGGHNAWPTCSRLPASWRAVHVMITTDQNCNIQYSSLGVLARPFSPGRGYLGHAPVPPFHWYISTATRIPGLASFIEQGGSGSSSVVRAVRSITYGAYT